MIILSTIAINLTRLRFLQKVNGCIHIWCYLQNDDGSHVYDALVRHGRHNVRLKPIDKRFHGYIKRTFSELDPCFIYHARVPVGKGIKNATILVKARKDFGDFDKKWRLWFRSRQTIQEIAPLPSLPRIITRPIGILLILAYYLTLPFYRFRLVSLMNPERLGHLAGNTEIYLAEQQLGYHGQPPKKTILYVPRYNFVEGYGYCNSKGRVANESLLASWKKKCWIIREGVIPRDSVAFLKEHCPDAVGHCRNHGHRDIFNALSKTSACSELEPKLVQAGEDILKDAGLLGKKWVCFHSRSESYVKNAYANLKNNLDVTRYAYRNTNPESFHEALQYLVDNDYHVIRMGMEKEPWSFQHPMAYDYATQERRDWMDLFLMQRCTFFLGNTSGIYTLAEIHRRPIVFTNFAPVGHFYSFNERYLTIFKRLIDSTDGHTLSLSEQRERQLLNTIHQDKWTDKKVVYQNNTPSEILAVVQEMLARIEGRWQDSEENNDLHKRFAENFPVDHFHQFFRGRVGAAFLKQNQHWLIEEPCVKSIWYI